MQNQKNLRDLLMQWNICYPSIVPNLAKHYFGFLLHLIHYHDICRNQMFLCLYGQVSSFLPRNNSIIFLCFADGLKGLSLLYCYLKYQTNYQYLFWTYTPCRPKYNSCNVI